MQKIELLSTQCAICETEGNATEVYPANFDAQAFTPQVFSARRLPDRIHYRMVKCNTCRLVRSDPTIPLDVLSELYSQSTVNYSNEIANLQTTYGLYLSKLTEYGVHKGALLEIGSGNGFFLQEALAQGYASARGVEPGTGAVEQAAPEIRPHLICDIMRPGLFEADEFDVVCLFQVLDHLVDPGTVLDECWRTLKPGGLILSLNHNVEALSARLLKERSPIVDIEHTYLYSPSTMTQLFEKHQFQVRHVGPARNLYTLYYLTRLMPLPGLLKRFALSLLQFTRLGRTHMSLGLGNLYLVAQKPQQ